jgi:hypothetical protein
MKPVEIVLRRGEGMSAYDGGVNLRYFVNTFINVTVKHSYTITICQ